MIKALEDVSAFNYIDDVGVLALNEPTALYHFSLLHGTLKCLCLRAALHKASPRARVMTWLFLQFNMIDMTVLIPQCMLEETLWLVEAWRAKYSVNIHYLRMLLGKLFHIAQWCTPTRLFLICMLMTLRECTTIGHISLSTKFHKDLQSFQLYTACTNSVSMMNEDSRKLVHIYVDACTTGCGALCQADAYHAKCPLQVLGEE